VTLAGEADRPVARQGLSALVNLGLPDLVAQSPESYRDIAIALARDESRRLDLRRGLRGRIRGSALMDGAAFARAVEAAYRHMWRAWCASKSR
jgi:protein O-GlcNAc transferase